MTEDIKKCIGCGGEVGASKEEILNSPVCQRCSTNWQALMKTVDFGKAQ